MTQIAYPFDGQDTTESQFSLFFRELQDTGVADSADSNALLGTADGGGLRVIVQPGNAIVRGFFYQSTDVETVPLDAAESATRFDRVVLRLDPGLNSIVLDKVKGVAGAGVPAPLTQTDTGVYEMPIAVVQVGPNATVLAEADATDDRRFVGTRVGVWKTNTRPEAPKQTQLGFNLSTSSWEFWDGSSWTSMSPTTAWTSVTNKPDTFPPSSHTHGWTDVSGKPATFPPSTHDHTWSSIQSKPATFAPSTHSHPQEHITNLRRDIEWLVDNRASSNHSHDVPTTVSRANGSDRVHGNTPKGSGWYSVWVDGYRNFCKNTSSIRYKENVRDYGVDPDAVLALRPVVYDRKAVDGVEGRKDEYGLIAEEVEPHVPELVVYDEDGQVDALRYDLLAVALLDVVKRQEQRLAALEARACKCDGAS